MRRFGLSGQLLALHASVDKVGGDVVASGLAVRCVLDTNKYPIGIKVPDDAMEELNIRRDAFQGNWNYTICPKQHIATVIS